MCSSWLLFTNLFLISEWCAFASKSQHFGCFLANSLHWMPRTRETVQFTDEWEVMSSWWSSLTLHPHDQLFHSHTPSLTPYFLSSQQRISLAWKWLIWQLPGCSRRCHSSILSWWAGWFPVGIFPQHWFDYSNLEVKFARRGLPSFTL